MNSRINLDLQASHKMLTLLDEANANTESVIDLFPGVFLIVNENHEVLRVNNGFAELFGMEAEDAFRLPLSTLFRKERWNVFAHKLRQLAAADEPSATIRFEMGLAVEKNAGEVVERPYHWTLTRMNVKRSGEGQLLTVFGDDISEMRETERRLMKVFTSIPLGIFTLNGEGRIGDSHSSYLESMLNCGKLGGARVEEVLFEPAISSMEPDAVQGIRAIRECMGKPELAYAAFARTFPQEIFHNTGNDPKDGRHLKISYQPIVFDGIVEQLLIILEDRTAIVNAEREMQAAARDREKSLAIERHSLAMYESAIRDPLTGLYTRLYMKDAVATLLWSHDQGEIAEASVVIFDIDHFKKVNDTYGHKNGDRVLARIAQAILSNTRETDIPVRFGGEEFVVFMPSDCDAAFALAERIRLEVGSMQFPLEDTTIAVTVSCGVARHRHGESLDDFLHRADQYLYQAKESGRNRSLRELRERPAEER